MLSRIDVVSLKAASANAMVTDFDSASASASSERGPVEVLTNAPRVHDVYSNEKLTTNIRRSSAAKS